MGYSAVAPVGTHHDQVEAVTLGVLGQRGSKVVPLDQVKWQPVAPGFGEGPGQSVPLYINHMGRLRRGLGVDWRAHRPKNVDLAVEATSQGSGGPQCPLCILGAVVADQKTPKRATAPLSASSFIGHRGQVGPA